MPVQLLVIGVEEKGEAAVEGAVVPQVRRKDESLEEPGGVRHVPFDRAGVGHGLHHVIVGLELGGEALGGAAHGLVAAGERAGIGMNGDGHQGHR